MAWSGGVVADGEQKNNTTVRNLGGYEAPSQKSGLARIVCFSVLLPPQEYISGYGTVDAGQKPTVQGEEGERHLALSA